jgi:ParB-like chromosome segregation protein Spo0J
MTVIKIKDVLTPNYKHRFRSDSVDDKTLQDLINMYGVTNPIVVKKTKRKKYILLDGLQRLKCCKNLGLKEIRATIVFSMWVGVTDNYVLVFHFL